MVLTALRGALGFLTRLPVGRDERAWDAFRRSPVAFPLAGYVVGAVLAVPFVLAVPAPTLAFGFLAWVVVVTGVNHADGLADLGDAAVVHGGPDERRAAMKDTAVGVGAVLALGVDVAGLALAGVALARQSPWAAAAVVIAAEVAAKLAVAVLVCTHEASHEGFGASFTESVRPRDLFWPLVAASPVLTLGGWATVAPSTGLSAPLATVAAWPPVGAAALFAGVAVAVGVGWWASRTLGGVGGDVFGATNELARLAALHAGVVAWTLW